MPQITPDRYAVNIGWDDAVHLDEETKRKMLDATPPYMRSARSKGIPSAGAGAVFPIDDADIKVNPFPIPNNWPRAFGMDVGWNWTAAIYIARNPNDNVIYGYTEHYGHRDRPSNHVAAMKPRGLWIPGFIDPAANQAGQDDGERLLDTYREMGLDLSIADNDLSGNDTVWMLLASGRLKIFATCQYWFAEKNHYRRDDKGRIVKKANHLMDATRYFVNSGLNDMKVKPADVLLAEHSRGVSDRSGYGAD